MKCLFLGEGVGAGIIACWSQFHAATRAGEAFIKGEGIAITFQSIHSSKYMYTYLNETMVQLFAYMHLSLQRGLHSQTQLAMIFNVRLYYFCV